MFWGNRENGDVEYVIAIPLFGYGKGEDGSGHVVTPLGGSGWDADGNTTFVNVLGPLFHYQSVDDDSTLMILAPLFIKHEGKKSDGVHVWPLFGRTVRKDEDGNPTEVETTMLSGLFREAGGEHTEALRMLPLFSYRSEKGGRESFFDYLSLYGYKSYSSGSTGVHIGTPLLFSYRGDADGHRRGGDRRVGEVATLESDPGGAAPRNGRPCGARPPLGPSACRRPGSPCGRSRRRRSASRLSAGRP